MAKQGTKKSGAAKQQKTGPSTGGKKDAPKGPGKGLKTNPTAAQAKKPVFEWMNFTKKSVDFVAAASKLAVHLENTYGQGVSITQYEKYLLYYASASDAERTILHLDQAGVQLAKAYQTAKDARDAERSSFRGDVAVADVQGTLASLLSTFHGPSARKRNSEEMDEASVEQGAEE